MERAEAARNALCRAIVREVHSRATDESIVQQGQRKTLRPQIDVAIAGQKKWIVERKTRYDVVLS